MDWRSRQIVLLAKGFPEQRWLQFTYENPHGFSLNAEEAIFCFSRQKGDNTIVALFNLSGESVSAFVKGGPERRFREAMTENVATLPVNGELLQPWEFRIYTRQ